MTTWRKVGCCLIAAVAAFGAFADGEEHAEPEIREGQLWTYDASTKKLTEIVEEGVAPWVFTLSAEGVITAKSSGANTVVDLRTATLPDNAPVIVGVNDIRTDSKCETLFLPETLTSLGGCAFYQWTALKRVEFPTATDLGIGGLAFSGSLITNVVLPQTMKRLGDNAFSGCGQLVYARIPDNLEYFGTGAFLNDSKLAKVEPFLPRTLTYFGGQFSSGGAGVLGGELELGFGTNEVDQTPIMVERNRSNGRAFWGCGNVTKFRFGPGVTDLNTCEFYMCSKVTDIEVGCNVTNIHCGFPSSLKRVVFNCAEDFSLQSYGGNDSALVNCKSVTDVVFRAWCDYPQTGLSCPFTGWSAKQARFIFPLQNAKWFAYAVDATKVTPWTSLSVTDRTGYFNKFGADAIQPIGLSVAVSGGLNAMWIVPDQPRQATFSLGDLPVQTVGATPVPKIFGTDGTELSADDFNLLYAHNDEPGEAFLFAIGKEGTLRADELVVKTFRVSVRTTADVFTWKACADGNFEDDANWTSASGAGGHPELVGDEIVLPKFASDTSYTVTMNSSFWLKSLVIGDVAGGTPGLCTATLLVSNGLEADRIDGDITVKAGGVLAQAGNSSAQDRNLYVKVGGDVVVEEGGAISATGAGYAKATGPGGTGGTCTGAAFAGYGYGNSKKPYGSILHPTDWGSATCYSSGGGAIRLDVAGDVTVNGIIEASGGGVLEVNYASCGGSVWIECETISGSGRIEAKEAERINGTTRADCNSSGGRIAVYQRAAADFSSFPATQFVTSRYGNNAAGTVYLESTATRDLYLQGGPNNSIQRTVFPMPDDGDDLSQYADLSIHLIGNAHLGVCDLHPGATVTVRSVEMSGNSLMTVAAGTVLRVVERLDTTGAKSVTGGGFEFVGEGTATVLGASKITSFESVVCTNAGKTIAFGTAATDKLTVGTGMDFVVKGAEGAPVTLVSTAEGESWFISMHANPGVVEVDHVAVQDSDASSGAPMLAISSQNLGNNANWGFSNPIVPGETITWTGARGTKWDAIENWDLGRAPVETDRISIPSGRMNDPVLPSGTYLFNTIEVSSGAGFTLGGGCLLTVTNDLTVAGSFAFTGGEELYLAGNANFAGGTVTKASGKIHLVGAGDQTIDFGDTSLFKVYSEKPSGDVSFGAHGFTADAFTCSASAPISFTFAAGATYTVPAFSLSSIGADRQITLVSSVPGTAWKLVTSESDQSVSGVEAHDSDASEGATIIAGTKSVAADNCTNWDTVTSVASWLGGSGNWTDPTKWSTGEVPGETESVTVSAADGEILTVTVPAEASAHVKALTVLAGVGGKATFLADGALTVEDDLDIRANGVVELNAFNDAGDAPNVVKGDARIRSGGVLSHTGPNDTEARKLHLMVLGDMTVEEDGAVNVESKGYSLNHGPGTVRCGPMHAATATKYCNNGTWTAEKHCYGSIRRPVSYGSGSNGSNNAGAYGGGSANLQVEGTLVVNGTVSAVGGSTANYPGAGGSVFIRCSVLEGAGSVKAHGNKYSGDGNCVSSGGRIAIYQSGATDLSAFSGKVTTMYPGSYNSACGTIYYEFAGDPANEGTLIVDNGGYDRGHNGNHDGNVYPHTMFGAFVEDVGIPFGEIVVTNKGSLMTDAGIPIKVTRKLAVSSNSEILSSVIDFRGADEAVFVGASRCAIDALVCTNAGKVIRFGTGANDKPVIAAGKSLVLKGEDENPVTLLPLEGAEKWRIDVDANASVDVRCVAVSNSTSVSASINAVNSHDLGGNEKWAFIAEIVPGEEIVWTGAKSTDWMDPLNWDRGRNPVLTDTILINALGDGANYPTLGGGIFAFERIAVGSGATFTLDGGDLTISNKLTVAGTLVFAGAERLRLVRDADFTGGQVVKGGSTVSLEGDDTQAVNLGDCTLRYLNIAKKDGTVAFTGGFAADILRCSPSGALTLEFSDGVAVRANDLYLNAGGTPLTLSGNGWNLWATEDRQAVANVRVSGCTATGATIYAGRSSTDGGGNSGWDFDAATGVWIGGDGDWTDAAHWAGGQVPTAAARVKLAVGENEQVKITIPANSAVQVKTLTLSGNAGGLATVVANSPLTAESLDLCENGVLELNCHDDDGEAPNVVTGDVLVRNGGRITHTGPANAENAKLHLKVLGGVTVEEGGSIDANAKGYAKAKGPGGTGTMCQGAAHAGWGYNNVAQPYGSAFRPVTWGSGNSGAPGGGAVHLVVAGTLTVDGCVSAEGGTSSPYAGAGGSVWLECARLVGSGVLSVTEGRRDTAILANREDCTSSGGRIAVYQTASKDFSAFPVSQMHTSWLGYNAAGTIWLQSVDPMSFCELHVELGNWAIYDTTRKTELVTADDLARMDAYRHVKIFVTGVPYASVSYDVTVRDLVLRASDAAGKKVPHVYLNGKTLKIRSMKHVNGRKWFKGYEAAIESGHVVLDGTALNPGRIEWIGGASGLIVTVK